MVWWSLGCWAPALRLAISLTADAPKAHTVLRPMEEADYDLFAQWFPDLGIKDGTTPTRERFRAAFLETSHLVAFAGCPVGFMTEIPQGDVLNLLFFVIDRQVRSRGIGERAMQLFGERAKASGFAKVTLECDLAHDRAYSFYTEKMGMRPAGYCWHLIQRSNIAPPPSLVPKSSALKLRTLAAKDADSVSAIEDRYRTGRGLLSGHLRKQLPVFVVERGGSVVGVLAVEPEMGTFQMPSVDELAAWPLLYQEGMRAILASHTPPLIHYWTFNEKGMQAASTLCGMAELVEKYVTLETQL